MRIVKGSGTRLKVYKVPSGLLFWSTSGSFEGGVCQQFVPCSPGESNKWIEENCE